MTFNKYMFTSLIDHIRTKYCFRIEHILPFLIQSFNLSIQSMYFFSCCTSKLIVKQCSVRILKFYNIFDILQFVPFNLQLLFVQCLLQICICSILEALPMTCSPIMSVHLITLGKFIINCQERIPSYRKVAPSSLEQRRTTITPHYIL